MNFFRKNRNAILKYGFLVFLMVFTIRLVFKNLDVGAITHIKDIIDKKYIAIGIYVILVYIFLEGVILKQIIDVQCEIKSKFLGIKLAAMGFYYNLITPFASGSQPMLIYVLTKYKVPFSEATGIITNKTLLYQAVVTIYCMIFFFLNIGILRSQMPTVMPLVILGISINAFTIMVGLLAILNPDKIKFVLNILVGYLSKFRILRFLKDKDQKINDFIDEYSQSVKFFMTNKKLLIKTTILTVIQLSAYFSVSFWIYKAFNLSHYHFMYMITLQTFLYMAVSPIPTPGNIGANEIAFFTIFANVFPKPILGYAVLLYGGLVYYLILIGSGIMTIFTHFQIKEKNTVGKSSDVSKI